jgi:hypothetical protein
MTLQAFIVTTTAVHAGSGEFIVEDLLATLFR